MKKTNIYLQHGWGFDAECWYSLLPYCRDCSFTLGERGYFGGGLTAHKVQEPCLHVTVCHSLGLHLLDVRQLQRTRLLVIIAGFHFFHGERDSDGRFSRRHVARMLTDLSSDPLALLEKFYHDCSYSYTKRKIDRSVLNTKLLYNDLILLDRHSFDMSRLREIPKILVLHGMRDRVVPKERGVWLADSLGNASFSPVEDAGHGLIFTHPEQCWQMISKCIG